jgi:non-heme chloroperoxidase
MLFLGQQGYRVIAHDRRGHGRSGQSWSGNNLDTYADDLAELIESLDLKEVTLVGHSTGGGEVTRYIGRHGTGRVAKLVLIGAIPPLMLKTENNPGGLPLSVFDGLRSAVIADRSQFFIDLSLPFYGYNKPGAKISQGVRDSFWQQGMQSSIVGAYECIKAFSETDLTEDLKKVDVPTLILHGDADQIVPIGASALMSSKIVKNASLKVYPGAPHGMTVTLANQINTDLLAFLTSGGLSQDSDNKMRPGAQHHAFV